MNAVALFVVTSVEPMVNETVGHAFTFEIACMVPLNVVGGGAEPVAWFTVYVRPPTVMCADRAAPVLAAADIPMVAFVVPLAFVTTLSHVASETAVQAQPLGVVICVLRFPPAEPTDANAGLSVYRHWAPS